MKKLLTAFSSTIFALCILAPAAAHAERTTTEVFQQCGIGGLIFGHSSPTFAAISNATWDFGTTAASSDASDACAISSSSTQAAIFIHESFDVLEAELAKGEGVYLDSLATLMHCGDRTASDAIASVRAEFGETLTSEGYANLTAFEKSDVLYQIIVPQLAENQSASCVIAS